MTAVVIVGGGQAGCQVAASLRELGFEGSIDIIASETELPYQRPPLSKSFLKNGNTQALALRADAYYSDHDIQLHRGLTVTDIHREAKKVQCDDGQWLSYDALVLATGVSNIAPPIAGVNAKNVHQIRTLVDAQNVSEALPDANNIVVVGAGFIGLEFASVAIAMGKRVTVVEAADRVMARAVSTAISEVFLAAHQAQGIEFRLQCMAKTIQLDDEQRVSGLALSNGEVLEADLLLLATGVAANSGLAEAAGLTVEQGVVVDSTLRTSDPSIFAIGDCARFPLAKYTADQVRLESVQVATDQARCVAAQIHHNNDEHYCELPWFWSDQGDYRLQMAGLSNESDHFHSVQKAESKWVVFGFNADELVSVETINSVVDHQFARRLLKLNEPVDFEQLRQVDFDMKTLFKHKTKAAEQQPVGATS